MSLKMINFGTYFKHGIGLKKGLWQVRQISTFNFKRRPHTTKITVIKSY